MMSDGELSGIADGDGAGKYHRKSNSDAAPKEIINHLTGNARTDRRNVNPLLLKRPKTSSTSREVNVYFN